MTTNSDETKRMKTVNYGRSVIYVHSSRAKLNVIQFFTFFKLYSRDALIPVMSRSRWEFVKQICVMLHYLDLDL